MENSRLKNSALNFASGFFGRVLTILLNFIVRTIFIYCLNEAYLSINGLYSNILTVLSLAELGFGSAMVYRMYAPVAVKDYQKLEHDIIRLAGVQTILPVHNGARPDSVWF